MCHPLDASPNINAPFSIDRNPINSKAVSGIWSTLCRTPTTNMVPTIHKDKNIVLNTVNCSRDQAKLFLRYRKRTLLL